MDGASKVFKLFQELNHLFNALSFTSHKTITKIYSLNKLNS